MITTKNIEEAYKNFSSEAFKPGALDSRTKELVGVAVSIMADCVPCTTHHYKEAIKAGATDEEISELLPIIMSINAGSKRAKYLPLLSDLSKERNQCKSSCCQ